MAQRPVFSDVLDGIKVSENEGFPVFKEIESVKTEEKSLEKLQNDKGEMIEQPCLK